MPAPQSPISRAAAAGRSLLAASGCALALAGAVACERAEPLRFTVLFEQNHEVEAGDAVVYKEMEVGRVTGVGLDANGKVSVEVQIEPRYQGAMATTSLVSVERAGVLGGRRLVVPDGEGERLPLPSGSTVIGHEATTPGVFERLRAASQGAMAGLGAVGADLEQWLDDLELSLDEIQASPEAEELRAALQRAGEEVAAGSERLRSEGVAAVRQRAQELQRKLEAEGKTEEARELGEQIERWLEEAGGEGQGQQ
jgi:ABC-type transporter Mla subunit MlaD